ncbi:DegT/DnrJ/EryC1/StrS family aminotransferase [Salinarimonas ramus]|uniref:Aminotransferase DegT n=1 Tax=Salinarimonas ramus TaxID=690164 RepID=A0A917V2D0_9HYPH|nr:DegT/DnrJ/EryC1/StrS family aminotransferase [Salinarimonas ramus]GGK27216.1 aminotransferase DegT [Salinarimonas ramus]
MTNPIPFIDLPAQRRRLGPALDEAVARVMDHCGFILGREVDAFESALREFTGARYALGVASGTDALALVLMAKGVRPGDAILVPAFTFAATAEVVVWLGATPIFCDVEEETFNLSPDSLVRGIETARAMNLRPVGVIAVDLYGRPADYDRIEPIVADAGMWLLTDAAQSFGTTYKGRTVGTIGLATATSFFPSKPLGAYGDAGALFTDDEALATTVISMRMHGMGAAAYDHVEIGMNGRLDAMQAAILVEKLKIFPDEIAARRRVAARYNEGLSGVARTPAISEEEPSVWAQYTLRIAPDARDGFRAALQERGVPTAVHYPKPLNQQPAYARFPSAGNGVPVSERLAREVVSLPMHAYLDEATQDRVIEAVRAAL